MFFDDDHYKPTLKNSRCKGYSKTIQGYVLVRKTEHPNNHNGYVKEHRLVMEFVLQRYLTPDEDVHHINGIKTDNSPDNLMLIKRSEHISLHNLKDKNYKRSYDDETVVDLYSKGYSIRDVADFLGVGKTAISSAVKRLGISRKRTSRRNGENIKSMRSVLIG